MQKTTRPFYPEELQKLKSLQARETKAAKTKVKFSYFLVAALVGISCNWLAANMQSDFWVFVFGTIAVFGYGFIVFMPYEMFKERKRLKNRITTMQGFIDKGVVETYPVKATRIAFAAEYEDESDLYIVELAPNEVLYLWDMEYCFDNKFPCLDFDIYEDAFANLAGGQIYPRSKKIEPVKIDKKAKWDYLQQVGVPGHLQTEHIHFDDLIKKFQSFG